MTQPYNQPTHTTPWKGKDGTTELDPGDLNDTVIPMDYCDMIGYRLKSYQ